MASPYRRVILKLSGEALGLDGKLFCHEKFEQVARMLIDIQHTGVELAVVIGGGQRLARPPRRSHAHGHCGSRPDGHAGHAAKLPLHARYAGPSGGARRGDERRGHSPLCRELQHRGRHRAPAGGRILFLACGLGNPCFSTDSAVVLRAIELECDAILMAKNIDGVYTADPHVDPSATLIPRITYAEAAERDLRVMDAAAFIMLRENAVPVVRVFGLEPPDNVLKVLAGDPMGTILTRD